MLRIRKRRLTFLGYILRKGCSENLTLKGHTEDKKRQKEMLISLPNELVLMDGSTGSGEKQTFLQTFKGSDVVEKRERLRPEET